MGGLSTWPSFSYLFSWWEQPDYGRQDRLRLRARARQPQALITRPRTQPEIVRRMMPCQRY